MLKEKEKRPNNKREDEVKTVKIGERESGKRERQKASMIDCI